MGLLDKVIPLNLFEEKSKFFSDFSYNPQFTYQEEITKKNLLRYGLPKPQYLELAKQILKEAYFGRNETELLMMEGSLMDQDEVTQKFQTFLEMHGIDKKYQIVWSSSFTNRATITQDTIKLRTNAEFRKEGLIGVIYHEIGTHALRRVNYEKQPWFEKKKEFGLSANYLRTEEGLAVLHALLPHTYKLAYNTAIRYVAVEYAQTHSLSELWHFLGQYILDPETRWMVTFRQKRGITNTNQGGGFTKDIVYFEGMIEVWQWLKEHDFDLSSLYYGKISYEDTKKVRQLSPDFSPLLPSFFTIDRDQYAQEIFEIGKTNYLTEL